MTNKLKVFIPAFVFFFTCFINKNGIAQDEAVVWVQLKVTNVHERHFLAGEPPAKVGYNTETSFTIYGFYTFNQLNVGTTIHYMAYPGMGSSGRMPQVMDLSIIQSHPCQDGQSLVIDKKTAAIPAEIRPGWIRAITAGNGRIKLQLEPSEIDAEMLECSNPDCVNGFGFEYGENIIGCDRAASVEDDDGYEEYFGYDLIELEYKLLKEIAAGSGEVLLTIPVSIEKVYNYEEDTPTGPESGIITYRVDGWIGAPPSDEL